MEAAAVHLGSRPVGLMGSSDWDSCLEAAGCGVQETDGTRDGCRQTGVCGAPGVGKISQSWKLSENWDRTSVCGIRRRDRLKRNLCRSRVNRKNI